MSPKREHRFWTRENAPLIILGIGLILALIAAGIVLWIINVAPVISRVTG
jgi:CHASE1-domain containing sensor protein